MEAIRKHTPDARFIATEDLGKTYATPLLGYQARHENARRYLSYDLLCGRMCENAEMRDHLSLLGIRRSAAFDTAYACPPDILGYNYYVTGERWLDERLARYPRNTWGGNEHVRYADVEAVRVCIEGLAGPEALLEECARRYDRPLAITEAHLACTPDEQVRWLREIHAAAVRLRNKGVPVRAMTMWSLFGAYDWNSTLTRKDGYYESGAFDVSSGAPRITAVGQFIRKLTGEKPNARSARDGCGWWNAPSRILFEPCSKYAAC
jgi:dTDP-4-dehydrorhamnose reductase